MIRSVMRRSFFRASWRAWPLLSVTRACKLKKIRLWELLSLLGLRISWLKTDTWLNPLHCMSDAAWIIEERPLTCACSGYIFFLHLETSEAPGTCTSYKSSKQKDELRGNGGAKRILQCDFAQGFQRDTICNWISRQNMHERHLWYVATTC
jgi:hypothetical protein